MTTELRAIADQLLGDEPARYVEAVKALARLEPWDAFERASPVYTAPDRASDRGRERAVELVWGLERFAKPLDPRWLPFLAARMADETDRDLRACIVGALGSIGADAAQLVVESPRDDDELDVFHEMILAIERIGPQDGVRALVEAAHASARGERKRALARALATFGATDG